MIEAEQCLDVPPLDRAIGLSTYSTRAPGIGGRIKRDFEDFQVEEILEHSQLASLESKGEYLLCQLTKFGMDTFHALELIRSKLGCSRGSLSVAGIKDRRAVTRQYMTIRRQSAAKVSSVKILGLSLEPLGYVHTSIASNAISSNRFRVKITDMKVDRIPPDQLEDLRTRGFANFFGYQRFGSRRPISHEVGRSIVRRDFRAAVECFISRSFPSEPEQTRYARDHFRETGDCARALEEFPVHLRHERLMLEYLKAHPSDFIGALRVLPLRLLKLFVHAYQAFLFNRRLSELLVELGDLRALRRSKPLSVPGYLTSRAGREEDQAATKLLREEGISPRAFYVGPLWQISSAGAKRAVRILPKDLTVAGGQPGEAQVAFELPRGSYATVLLRELMKPENPIASGF